MTEYVCIGVPYWLGESHPDRTEVAAVQASGLAQELGAEWVEIAPDFGSDEPPVVAVNRALAQAIMAQRGRVPLVFASDCTSCLGMMKGLEAHQPDVLWYDAHGDFNTPETTPSGFLGGMPLAALVGRGNQHLMEGLGMEPIAETRVIISDARNLDPEEALALRASAVLHLPRIDDLMTYDWNGRTLYIHFDTDVVDSGEMPAMNYPEPGGPTLAQTAASLRHVVAQARPAGVLFSLWNDTLPGADRALQATLELVRALGR